MSIWLRKRLAVWLGVSILGGTLWWNAGETRAQDNGNNSVRAALEMYEPRAKLTRDDAAKYFVRLLLDIHQDTQSRSFSPNLEPRFSFAQHGMSSLGLSSFSVKSEQEFGRALEPMLKQMANDWWWHQYKTKRQEVVNETENSATVTLEVDSKLRSLVLIQEDGGWGVDVFETHALWTGLQGEAKTGTKARWVKYRKDLDVRAACDSNLKQITLALSQYKAHHNNKFPPANSWMDALKPYLQSEEVLHCPANSDAKSYGYAFNSKLSNKPDSVIPIPQGIVAVYETNILKPNAHGMGENHVFRHSEGANYSFGGYTRWYHKTRNVNFKLKP